MAKRTENQTLESKRNPRERTCKRVFAVYKAYEEGFKLPEFRGCILTNTFIELGEIKEAAVIDGGGVYQRFRNVILPIIFIYVALREHFTKAFAGVVKS